MKKKLISTVLLLILGQLVLFFLPLVIGSVINNYLAVYKCMIFNSLFTFYLVKKVEKEYYSKYNKINSMLYMVCPFLGILALTYLIELFGKAYQYKLFFYYYIIVYGLVLFINIIYIIFQHKR